MMMVDPSICLSKFIQFLLLTIVREYKVVPVHNIKTGGSGDIAPIILNLDVGWR